MKTTLTSVFAMVMALTLLSTNAVAGLKSTYTVAVGTTTFSGALASARSSADSRTLLGCRNEGNATAFCYARNSVGKSLSCTTNSPSMVAAVRSMNSDSYIRVRVAGGRCTFIMVSNFSSLAPKR